MNKWLYGFRKCCQQYIIPRWRGPGGGRSVLLQQDTIAGRKSCFSKYFSPINALLLLSLWILLNACATSHRDKMREEAEENAAIGKRLESQFTTDQMTEEKLEAFEVRAQQKLQDFADYLNILADTSIDSIFREQAIRQTLNLFASDSVTVTMDDQKKSIRTFLEDIRQQEGGKGKFDVAEIEVTTPLASTTPRQFSGVLSFQQTWSGEEAPVAATRQMHILVKKVEKSFGEEKKQVWEVFLGDME